MCKSPGHELAVRVKKIAMADLRTEGSCGKKEDERSILPRTCCQKKLVQGLAGPHFSGPCINFIAPKEATGLGFFHLASDCSHLYSDCLSVPHCSSFLPQGLCSYYSLCLESLDHHMVGCLLLIISVSIQKSLPQGNLPQPFLLQSLSQCPVALGELTLANILNKQSQYRN